METQAAVNTSTLWTAVGSKPLDDALPELEKDGWKRMSAGQGNLKPVVLSRERQLVRLFSKAGRIGMVQVLREE